MIEMDFMGALEVASFVLGAGVLAGMFTAGFFGTLFGGYLLARHVGAKFGVDL